MSFFSKQPFYLGIETTNSSIRIIALEKSKQTWKILYSKELSLKEARIVELPFISKSCLTSLLSQRQVMMRTLSFDLKKESDVRKAIAFHIEPQLPFPLDEATLQTELAKKSPQGYVATIHALKNDALRQHLETLHTYHIEPDAVSSPALALNALLSLSPPEENMTQFLINIGEEETTVILVKGTTLIDQRSFLNEKNLISNIHKALLSLESQHPKENNKTILLFGKNSSQWVTALQERSEKHVHTLSLPFTSLSSEELNTFAMALGAALSQVKAHPINFRQKNFQTPHPHKLITKPFFFSLLLTLVSVGLLLGGSQLYFKEKKSEIHNQISSLLKFQGKEEIASSELRNAADYESLLSSLEKSISNESPRYPLQAKIPPLSEVLHWLSEEISNAPPPLQGIVIESFDYKIIRRPTPLMTQERYQVQIEISFSADSPNVKEGLQEFLQNASFIVNEGEEIDVSFFDGKGKAQFILKDSTRYESFT